MDTLSSISSNENIERKEPPTPIRGKKKVCSQARVSFLSHYAFHKKQQDQLRINTEGYGKVKKRSAAKFRYDPIVQFHRETSSSQVLQANANFNNIVHSSSKIEAPIKLQSAFHKPTKKEEVIEKMLDTSSCQHGQSKAKPAEIKFESISSEKPEVNRELVVVAAPSSLPQTKEKPPGFFSAEEDSDSDSEEDRTTIARLRASSSSPILNNSDDETEEDPDVSTEINEDNLPNMQDLSIESVTTRDLTGISLDLNKMLLNNNIK